MSSVRFPAAILLLSAVTIAAPASRRHEMSGDYLAEGDARRSVSVETSGAAAERIVVMTEAVAVKETGPKATVKVFGETYRFAPSFFAVRAEASMQIEFWNLQPDDEHDVMILDPEFNVVMKQALPPLSKRSWFFAFHREGLYRFYCTVHLPEMTGQILVLPKKAR